MTGDRPPPDDPALDALVEDWITLWQTEIAALAADREAAEAWAAGAAAWASLGAAWLRAAAAPPFARPAPIWPAGAWPAQANPPDERAAEPPRPAPAAAAPAAGGEPGHGGDGGDDPALRARLAELERRLADLEGGARRSRPYPRPASRRKPRA